MKKIKGYSTYSITEDGRVFTHRLRPGFLAPKHDKSGYVRYGMVNDTGKYGQKYAHQLVAEAYLPNPEKKPEVNHLDHDKSNNHVSNLAWCTHLENIQHDWAKGKRKPTLGEALNRGKTTIAIATKVRELYRTGMKQVELAKMFGISQPTVSQIVLEKTWRNI